MIVELDLVVGSSLIAGWNEISEQPLPHYFGYHDGPTFYQGNNLTAALRNASGAYSVVHPHEWPTNTQPFEMSDDPNGWHIGPSYLNPSDDPSQRD